MKVMHISPTYYSANSVIGGGERYVIYFSKALMEGAKLSDQSVDLTLLAFGEQVGVYELDDGIHCTILAGIPWDTGSLVATSLQEALETFSVVFVHQCLSAFGLFVAAQAKIAGKLVIGLDHGSGEHPLVTHSPEVGDIFDLLIAYSEFGARSFFDINSHIELIRGPVDDHHYKPEPVERMHHVAMAVGRLLPHKGFERIIRALPKGMKLKIFGAPYDLEYKAYLEECAIDKDVDFFHAATDQELRSHLHAAGLFVHASTHQDYRGRFYAKPELLGLAPLEALACGIPTCVSSAGALPELAVVEGCVCFSDDAELERLLRLHASHQLTWADKWSIHNDLKEKFGLAQFGKKLMLALAGRGAL